ncbi:hypothetical protein BJV78DRAFT_1277459 [Lactifluus subvellereus]|nr:hypothetical protein BJV78DRAFT_1277459 [Lactifluus subvellereus]
MVQPNQPLPRAYFRPWALENLALADETESLNPLLDPKVLNLLPKCDAPQIFSLNGRGSRSMLRTLQHGLEVEPSRRPGPRPLRFLSSAPTLPVQQIGDDALLQVHPQGIRQVLADRRVNEWRVPSGKSIVATMTNARQDRKAMEARCLH